MYISISISMYIYISISIYIYTYIYIYIYIYNIETIARYWVFSRNILKTDICNNRFLSKILSKITVLIKTKCSNKKF